MHKDPKMVKSRTGHGPGVRGLAGPYVVTEVKGSKVTLKHVETGVQLESVHAETLVYMPESVVAREERLLELDPETASADALGTSRRSPGQILEDASREAARARADVEENEVEFEDEESASWSDCRLRGGPAALPSWEGAERLDG